MRKHLIKLIYCASKILRLNIVNLKINQCDKRQNPACNITNDWQITFVFLSHDKIIYFNFDK
jgi:hypothetical protein